MRNQFIIVCAGGLHIDSVSRELRDLGYRSMYTQSYTNDCPVDISEMVESLTNLI